MVAATQRTVRIRIEGRVQGVGFRAFVERQALRRALDGYVRNRRDGGVEVLVRGDAFIVDDFVVACGKGPIGSRVDMIKTFDDDDDVARGFVVAPTV